MRVRVRLRIWMLLSLLGVVAASLSPIAAGYREASRRRAATAIMGARLARADRIARALLERRGWSTPWQRIDALPGAGRSCHVYVKSVGGNVERVIVPHDEDEHLIVLLHDVGPRSGNQSRILVCRDDLSVIAMDKAE